MFNSPVPEPAFLAAQGAAAGPLAFPVQPVPGGLEEPARGCASIQRVRLDGSTAALREGAAAVRAHLCPHAAAVEGPATLLAQELVWQVLSRRRRRPIWLTLSCEGDALTVSAEVSGLRPGLFEPGDRDNPAMSVVRRIAEEWGAQPEGSGVRLWGRLDLTGAAAGAGGDAADRPVSA